MQAFVDRVRTSLRAWRRAAIYVVLTAFIAQSLVTQGHWHLGNGDPAASAIASVVGQPNDQQPAKGDPKSCPICHLASVAGAFFMPAAPVLRVPPLLELFAPRAEQAIAVERTVAHWRSRAPPSV